jgi:hypothetical protein
MFRSPVFLAAAALALLAPFSARAETISQILDGKRLAVAVNCVDRVEIQPDANLAGKIKVEASSSDADDLRDFVFDGGETASVTRERRVCIGLRINRPGVTVAIHVPAGMAIDIKNGGSTDFTVGAVGGALNARLAGSGTLKAETVTDLDLSIAGSSDVQLGRTNGAADIHIAGSGDVKIASAMMPSLKIDVRGSGTVQIEQGEIGTLGAAVAGSGDLTIKAVVKDASLSTVGSGDIEVAKVTGNLTSSKVGSGTIRAGRS